LDQSLWSFTFFRSSTFALELLATTGLLGLLSFLALIFKILKERDFFLPLILAILASLLLPFSFTLIILFFILLAIFSVIHAHNNPHKFNDIELYFVALKRGLLAAKNEEESIRQNSQERKYSKLLPLFFFTFFALLIGIPLYFTAKLFISDLLYQKSLIAFSQNNGQQAYELQLASIKTYPYRDLYFRSFSQINIAIANALTQQNTSEEVSQQNQQFIIQLIQDAITSGRNAALLSPQSQFNWSNLSSIYRNLIGFGQDADKFAIATSQQAIALDPANPLQYIDLGGIYYQLGQYDEAIRQFQIAINLKNDYANAYYNLGHALEMKGNLTEALAAYQIVKSLVGGDENNINKINEEIKNLEAKISNAAAQPSLDQDQTATASADIAQSSEASEQLKINQPEAALPERDPKVKIPAPVVTIEPTPAEPTPSSNEKTSPEEPTTPAPTSN
jgi:tetratricopeptide (TPR) repeat protein